MLISFIKMTGAGNDFILIDNRSKKHTISWSTFAPIICNRRYGVGADGLLILENSKRADFALNYYNADGSYGGMCGNGGRCAAHFVMQENKTSGITFEALGHKYTAKQSDMNVDLKMMDPKRFTTKINLALHKAKLEVHFIDTGAPHTVIYMGGMEKGLQDRIKSTGITEIGRTVRNHPHFAPEGTNVDFIDLEGEDSISMRTYERGVEDETLACGTGAVASALITSLLKGLKSPVKVRTRSNEILMICFKTNKGKLTDIHLIGSARIVFKGSFNYQASAVPLKLK